MSYQYDLVIIGSGPGGYVAAIRAGQYGLKTALIEQGELGGTCLNRDCIPTQAMLHAGEILHHIRSASSYGISTAEPDVDLEKLYHFRDKTVKKLQGGIQSLLKAQGVDILKGRGILVGPHQVRIESVSTQTTSTATQVTELSTGSVILAMGSRPVVPPIPGLEEAGYWTSRTMLEENPQLPARMIIIGGGVIGVESATILKDLGVKVTVVEMLDQLLPRMDGEIAETLRRSMKKSGIDIDLGVRVSEVKQGASGKECILQDGNGEKRIETDEIMVAVGRGAVLDTAGLEAAGLSLEKTGIPVDEHLRTALPGVYAIGDVTGKWQLAHAASADALAAVDTITGRHSHINRNLIPSCVYTRPEISSVGMTAEEAEAAGYSIKIGSFPMAANGKSMIMGGNSGFVKLVTDQATGEILGAHLMGERATDMIAGITLAMGSELSIEELGAAVYPHPTVSEAIMESAHDVEALSIHKPGGHGTSLKKR